MLKSKIKKLFINGLFYLYACFKINVKIVFKIQMKCNSFIEIIIQNVGCSVQINKNVKSKIKTR